MITSEVNGLRCMTRSTAEGEIVFSLALMMIHVIGPCSALATDVFWENSFGLFDLKNFEPLESFR